MGSSHAPPKNAGPDATVEKVLQKSIKSGFRDSDSGLGFKVYQPRRLWKRGN